MAIEFHCSFCGKQIRAADEHGGKHGKCPLCHQSVYIPLAETQVEPLGIAPVDEAAEREQQRLAREARELQLRLLKESEAPADGQGAGGTTRPAAAAPSATTERDVHEWLTQYAIAMADGQLDRADQVARRLRGNMPMMQDGIQRMLADELPPAGLEKIPRPVLVAFFKQLRG